MPYHISRRKLLWQGSAAFAGLAICSRTECIVTVRMSMP